MNQSYFSRDIAKSYLDFFASKNHAVIPSSPLIPEGDASVLFNIAGMQPLIPYFHGTPHPAGKRLANIQKCIRTNDIDDVGDNTHCTFFEMLGNWSLGDYFKNESITWSWEFLTSKEWLGLDPRMISVTVFEGDENAPRDEESAEIWKSLGVPADKIAYLPAEDNWWAAGPTGPCGPDTEIFYWVGDGLPPEGSNKQTDSRNWMEIWNNVFMEFNRIDETTLLPLAKKSVDTGMGLERVTVTLNKAKSVYDTDLFSDVMQKLKALIDAEEGEATYIERSARIVADHTRAAVNLIADGVVPRNVERGYILRRLIRRAIREMYKMHYEQPFLASIGEMYIGKFSDIYASVKENGAKIIEELEQEEEKFRRTIKRGLKEFERMHAHKNQGDIVSGEEAFKLFETFGFPIEMTAEIAKEKGLQVDMPGFHAAQERHQKLSRTSTEGKFKGGLGDQSGDTIALHTACHLMLAGLRLVLGNHVHQAGSNITPDRLRFDFTHHSRLTQEQIAKVQSYVNTALGSGLVVTMEEEDKSSAQSRGVEGSFWEKYPDRVNVYKMTGADGVVYSEELCGGPHISGDSTNVGEFAITKEESSGSGVRRIKAVLRKK